MNDGRNKLGKRLGPGIWEDADGHIHWSIPELLAMVDLPDTPENRDEVIRMLTALMKKNRPNDALIYRKSPEDEGEDIR